MKRIFKLSGNPKRLANQLILSLMVLIILSFATIKIIYPSVSYKILLAILLVIGPSIYFGIHYVIETFIYKKVKLIYKNIHTLKLGKEPIEKLAKESDVLDFVHKEVLSWAISRNTEIQQLKDNANFRREFIGNLSHELKTPIFNIQGYVLTLLDGGLYDENINKKYLKKASSSIERMINLVDDLTTISMLESGSVNLEQKDFDIQKLVEDVVDYMEVKAQKKKVNLYISHVDESAIMVNADRNKIQQVLVNLVGNAINYRSDRKDSYVRLSIFDMEDNALIEVTDNGIGIAEESIPRLFERFYRADKARSRDSGGTGLGLAIVKHIVDAHKQTINLRSSQGIGSTFGFTLKKVKP